MNKLGIILTCPKWTLFPCNNIKHKKTVKVRDSYMDKNVDREVGRIDIHIDWWIDMKLDRLIAIYNSYIDG